MATATAGWRTRTAIRIYTLFVQGGRVLDTPAYPLLTGLREIAKIHDGDFRLTANQNLIIANVSPAKRPQIEKLMERIRHHRTATRRARCGSARWPASRCRPAAWRSPRRSATCRISSPNSRKSSRKTACATTAITIRMTGCPNGCARPFLAEIGFVGRAPGKYNLYLGGGFAGQRLSKLYRESVPAEDLKPLLAPIIDRYAKEREHGERFGDFCIRAGIRRRHRPRRGFPQEHQTGSLRQTKA